MKPHTNHYEILLFTGTRFASQELCSRGEKDAERKLSPAENLEKACWEGLLFEMLPELTGQPWAGRYSVIWQVLAGKQFLYITAGPCLSIPDHETSIDPYYFSGVACEN